MKYIEVYGKERNEWWHDVREELPKCENGYLLFLTVYQGESGFMAVRTFDGEEWREGLESGLGEWRKTDLITHWRELPRWP